MISEQKLGVDCTESRQKMQTGEETLIVLALSRHLPLEASVDQAVGVPAQNLSYLALSA